MTCDAAYLFTVTLLCKVIKTKLLLFSVPLACFLWSFETILLIASATLLRLHQNPYISRVKFTSLLNENFVLWHFLRSHFNFSSSRVHVKSPFIFFFFSSSSFHNIRWRKYKKEKSIRKKKKIKFFQLI